MKLRLLITAVLLLVLALGSFWALQAMRSDTDAMLAAAHNDKPDYYLDHFTYVKMAIDGNPRYSITGKRMEHYPANDSFRVDFPVIHSLDASRPPMLLRSDRAVIEDDNSKIHMYGNALAERDARGSKQQLSVKSEYLLLLPDDDIVSTDLPAQITLGKSTLNGVGMLANNATLQLTLRSRVNGIYYAPPR